MTSLGADPAGAPAVQQRVVLAVAISLIAAGYVLWFAHVTHQTGPGGSDFDQLWYAARVTWHGRNPYDEIGPGRAFAWEWPLVYPLPTVVAFLPFAVLPLLAARVLFASLSAGVLTFALSGRGLGPLAALVSAAVVDGVRAGQLSVAMTAGVIVNALAFTLVLKPPFGITLLAANPRRPAFIIAAAAATLLAVASFALQPQWISNWMHALSGASHLRFPLFAWGGPLLLLALFRWRRLDARVLLACVCVPHTPVVYDVVPLALLVRTVREGIAFGVLTYIALLAQDSMIQGLDPGAAATVAARILNFAVYFPALVLVLSRPNTSTHE
jgi:hypothetical protein